MKVIYFYHIPKCGGTFIDTYLRDVADILNGVYKNFNTLKSKEINIERDNWIKRSLKMTQKSGRDYIFIHHHHGFPGITELYDQLAKMKAELINDGHELYMFTCIRNPVDQFVSRVNFLINTGQDETLSIRRLLDNKTLSNNMYKYLMYNHPERYSENNDFSYELFHQTLTLFDKVFLLENIQSIQDWINSITKTKVEMPKKIINKSEHHIKPTLLERTEIEKINYLDVYFYNLISNGRV
ncbi:MAG TPA: hypothetical protein PKL31_03160 [Fulvivirga sp.]|nr:hypothetical protein [Fulvivirga sp.]